MTSVDRTAISGWLTVRLCFLAATFEGIDLQAAELVGPKIAPLFQLTPAQMGWFSAPARSA